jgi:hypothetical protein|nr:MAG TPA_asm: hypothetical protein [Caudoviricetes sp.]
MSVDQVIDDSNYLKAAGRYEGALSLLLCAVDASAAKMFPAGTKSVFNPKNDMGNGERFKRCLGYALKRDLSGYEPDESEYTSSSISIDYGGANIKLQDILYHDYRCNLVHEGNLPTHVGLDSLEGMVGVSDVNGFRFKISGASLILDVPCLDFIERIIRSLPINGGKAFPVKPVEKKLVFKDGVDVEDLLKKLKEKYHLKESKVNNISEFFKVDDNVNIDFKGLNKEEVKEMFKSAINHGKMNPGIIKSIGFIYDDETFNEVACYISCDGVLTDGGVDIICELSGKYKIE